MQFDSLSAFIDMGGYGFYVWLSYGVATALLLILILSSITGHKKVIKNIAQRKQREDKLRQVRNQRQKQDKQLKSKLSEEVTE
ncbi:heme exporter protein CcmD [Candidatus Colwellia aromaticivorans]|uniref:heme exporter protein CcmD n=1 Tax=Candidatus Colwellia aromaticivorans TaxID=2267621 RepID=UPI000DF3FABD|nr:heme exporter protein CcmD [Candidatus Colwellia aromaticivorans]